MTLCELLDYAGVLTVETFIVPSSHRPQQISASGAFFMLAIIKADKRNYAHTRTQVRRLHPSVRRARGALVSFIPG